MKQEDSSTMFFIDDGHKQNYQLCVEKFRPRNQEYYSTCYLAALPEIFKCFSLHLQVHGPFDWYFEHVQNYVEARNQAIEQPRGNTAPLTSQTTALVHLALNLWNGLEFDLAEGLAIWDSVLYKVALQAIDLRRRNPELYIQ